VGKVKFGVKQNRGEVGKKLGAAKTGCNAVK
jgi:hypothetical protein